MLVGVVNLAHDTMSHIDPVADRANHNSTQVNLRVLKRMHVVHVWHAMFHFGGLFQNRLIERGEVRAERIRLHLMLL